MTTKEHEIIRSILLALDNATDNGYDMMGNPVEIAVDILDQDSEVAEFFMESSFMLLDERIDYVVEIVKDWQQEKEKKL